MKKHLIIFTTLLFLNINFASALTDTTDDGAGIISARGQNLPNEGYTKAFDNSSSTKWLDFSKTYSWIRYQYANNKRSIVTEYTLTSANDAQERDPMDWNFQGSNNGGVTWVTLDSKTGQLFTARYQKKSYQFTNTTAYNIYRLEILKVRNESTANSTQLAEIELNGTTPAIPPNAINPNPVTDANKISLTQTLSWTNGSGAKSHDVYFGTSLNDVTGSQRLDSDLNGNGIVDIADIAILNQYWLANPAGSEPYAGIDDGNFVDYMDFAALAQDWMKSSGPVFKGNQNSNTFNPGQLELNTKYFWRVDEVNGPITIPGEIWSFTTDTGKASNPNPGNGSNYVSMNTVLSWSAGAGAITHDVYFGTTNPPPLQITQSSLSYNPGQLGKTTKYYWRIDEVGSYGTVQGDVWNFTTTDSNYSLVGKIMCGYQGWFACPGDNSGRSGWVHWSNTSSAFDYTHLKIEMWPDTNEYSKKYQSGFNLGSPPYYVFSSYDANTVDVHFRWMREYGIDGVFVQRFGSDLGSKSFLNSILSKVKIAANNNGRKYAVMYDFTNYNPSTIITDIQNDWTDLENTYKISNDPLDDAYIKHNGKPVIAIYGIGWFGGYADMGKVATIIQWFKDKGFTILIGVNNDWRTNSDSNYQLCISKADIIMPWNVGRYDSTEVSAYCNSNWVPDLNYCSTINKSYMVCIFPGFSWNNWNGGGFNQIPRNGGQFIWDQFYLAKNAGANMIYVAMFDEVDEATAIFKISSNPPPASGNVRFLTLEGLPNDEYLWLVGQASRGLRGEIPVNRARPAR